MNDIKKAAANDRNIDCGKGIEANASHCKVNFTLEEVKKQGQISQYLKQGRQNALSVAALQDITGLSARNVKKLVRFERQELHLPILSSMSAECGGYYFPADGQQGIEELTAYHHSMAAAINSIRKSMDFVAPFVRLCSDQFDFSDLGPEVRQAVEAAAGNEQE